MFFYFGLKYTTIFLEGITIFYYVCNLLLEILENIQSISTAIFYVLIITIDFSGLNSKFSVRKLVHYLKMRVFVLLLKLIWVPVIIL